MPTPVELRQNAAKKVDAAEAIRKEADERGRNLTAEEVKQINALLAESDELISQAEAIESLNQRIEAGNEPLPVRHTRDGPEPGATPPTANQPAIVPRPQLTREDPTHQVPQTIPAEARDHIAEGRWGWHCLGEHFMAVDRYIHGGGQPDQRLFAADSMQQNVGADGGFLIPPTFSRELFDGLQQDSESLLSMCDVYPVEGESLTFPRNAETSRKDGSRWGGVQGAWRPELGQMAASKPTVGDFKIEPKELYVFVKATNRSLRNSMGAVDRYIRRACRDELNFKIGDSIIRGDGVGKPLGLLNSPGTVTQTKEAGPQTADTILYQNIVKMYSRRHGRATGLVWFINQDTETQLNAMAFDSSDSPKIPVYLPANGLAGSPFATLMGRRVMPLEYCSTLGDAGDIILADLGFYAVGLRSFGVLEAVSIHLYFDYDQSAYRFQIEIDGQPWLHTPITPYQGTTTVSPFVILEAR